MLKRQGILLSLWMLLIALAAAGCGQVGTVGPPPQKASTVQGVAATGAPIHGQVTVADASAPVKQKTTTTGVDGSFAVDVRNMTPPYVLRSDWTDSNGAQSLFAFSEQGGTANINPLSNAIYAASGGGGDQSALSSNLSAAAMESMRSRHREVKSQLLHQLAQLFAQYGVVQDPEEDDYEADHTGLDALFDDVRIVVKNGTLSVFNKRTGRLIFTAPVNDLSSGTFYPENMPGGGSTSLDGAALYATYCASCHGPLATSSKRGESASDIKEAIEENTGGMGSLSSLSFAQIQAIAQALSGTPAPEPTSCTYTYSSWATCQSDGTQTRTVLTSSPQGCVGTPVLSQDCTYTPPTPSDCSYTYSAWGACQSDNTQTRTVVSSSPAGCTGTPVLSQACVYAQPACSYTYSSWGTCQSNGTQTRTVVSSAPSGCVGTPVLSQNCTYVPPQPEACAYTYSSWGTCQSNGTQTRTVQSSTPSGCVGTPVLSQSCTYTPPACSYTYSSWGTCQPDGTQTRTVQSSTPSGCVGTPVLSQTCTYTPPTPTCGSCHSIPPSTGRHSRHTFTSCATCHGTGYSSTTVNTATHMNGTVNIASTPGWNPVDRTCTNSCHGTRSW